MKGFFYIILGLSSILLASCLKETSLQNKTHLDYLEESRLAHMVSDNADASTFPECLYLAGSALEWVF